MSRLKNEVPSKKAPNKSRPKNILLRLTVEEYNSISPVYVGAWYPVHKPLLSTVHTPRIGGQGIFFHTLFRYSTTKERINSCFCSLLFMRIKMYH